ncbi:carboxypeptidase regulatory-like domain-containing protein [bacterium]|nr:carboxypeptidase regulatory-like domain-containing protein [bacterium]
MKYRIQAVLWSLLILSAFAHAANADLISRFRTASHEQRQIWVSRIQQAAASDTGFSISGTLYNLDPGMTKYAYVHAWTADPPPGNATGDSLVWKGIGQPDSLGRYVIGGLVPGKYVVQATADGYEDLYYDNVRVLSDARTVEVSETLSAVNVDFNMIRIMPGTSVVTGTVTDASTGKAIPGAEVVLISRTCYCFYNTFTDSTGVYTFGDMKADSMIIGVYADGYLPEFYQDAHSEQEAAAIGLADQEQLNIDFRLDHGGCISGIITDNTGAPAQGVFMQAITESTDSVGWIEPMDFRFGYHIAVTDSIGQYTIKGLPDGDYFIRADSPRLWGGQSAYYPGVDRIEDALPVTLSQGGDVTGIDFTVDFHPPIGVIEGIVRDKNGDPVVKAVISLRPYPAYRSAMWYYETARTDSTGHYRLETIPDDAYIVICTWETAMQYLDYFWPGTTEYEEAEPIRITAENPHYGHVDFNLPFAESRASISGQVRASDGHPLSGVNIQIGPAFEDELDPDMLRSGWMWTQTDSSGRYMAEHVPPGSYIAEASCYMDNLEGRQYFDHAETRETASILEVEENTQITNVNFDLTLRPVYGSLTGVVLDKQNRPVVNAYVEVMPDDAWMMLTYMDIWSGYTMVTLTNEEGRYRFPQLYHNDYRLAVYANGGYAFYPDAVVWDMATSLPVAGGDTVYADFRLDISEYSASISGHISSDWNIWYGYNDSTLAMVKGSIWRQETFVVTAKPTITIQSWPESERVYSAVTEADGAYTLTCPPGEYIVQAFASDFLPEYYDNVYEPSKAVIVGTSQARPATGIDMTLSPKLYWYVEDGITRRSGVNIISGTVTDEQGNAVAGADIYVYSDSGLPIFSTTTDETGRFNFAGLQNGTYYIQANKAGIGSVYNGNVHSLDEAPPVALDQNSQEINLILTPTGVDGHESLPGKIRLIGNYPNPFNPQTAIRFAVPAEMRVTLILINALGQEINRIEDTFEAGEHTVLWNGLDANGAALPSGLVFCRLRAGSITETRKMILIR